jgi:hypothetical protein
MVRDHAINDRRHSACSYDAGLEQREGAAEFALPRQLRHGSIEDGRGAVENNAQQWERNKQGNERQHQRRRHKQRRRGVRDNDARNDAEPPAEPPAGGLAESASREQEGETDADGRFMTAPRVEQKRQEEQTPHPRRGIEGADCKEEAETATPAPVSVCISGAGTKVCRGASASKANAVKSPATAVSPTTGRQAIKGRAKATNAGKVAFPRSPAKL